MRILFFDTKKYDKEFFEKLLPKYQNIEIEYTEVDISEKSAKYTSGYDAICAFVKPQPKII